MKPALLVLSIGVLGIGGLASCAEREKQPEQSAPVAQEPQPVQTPLSKFKGMPVKKPLNNNMALPNPDPKDLPKTAAPAGAAPDAK